MSDKIAEFIARLGAPSDITRNDEWKYFRVEWRLDAYDNHFTVTDYGKYWQIRISRGSYDFVSVMVDK